MLAVTRIGEYHVTSGPISAPLADVYQVRLHGRREPAVLELLTPLAADPAAVRRFQAAIPAIGRLRHPNLLPVEGWGMADGVPFVVVSAAGRETLADHAADRRLDTRRAVELLRQVAGAVDHAHRLGVTHGNLEPATILLDGTGSALVADFGLAPIAGASPVPGDPGPRAGNPAYVAPERVMGGAVGPRSDVYSFAGIVYELLTGATPFPGGTAAEQLTAHVREVPPPPSARDPRLDRTVDSIVLRGLAKDPAQRWRTCGELMDSLEMALARTGSARRARRARRSAPWLAAAALLVATALTLIFVRPVPASESPALAVVTDPLVSGTELIAPAGRTAATTPPFPTASRRPSASPETAQGAVANPAPSATPAPHLTLRLPSATASARPTPTASGTPASAPSIAASDRTPAPRQAVEIDGRRFDPARQYAIAMLQSGSRAQWLLQGPTSTRPDGSFTAHLTIPEDAQAGKATILACSTPLRPSPSDCAVLDVTIHAA